MSDETFKEDEVKEVIGTLGDVPQHLSSVIMQLLDKAATDEKAGKEPMLAINKQTLSELLKARDTELSVDVNQILHDKKIRELEGTWRSIRDLELATDFSSNISLAILDASKDEVNDDISDNVSDWTQSELFDVLYAREYDQHGGSPFGAVIGLYEFGQSDKDLGFLRGMAAVCKESHVPFVASASSQAFNKDSFDDVAELRDVDGVLSRDWRTFRKQEASAYLGLTLPRYVARPPYEKHLLRDVGIEFTERAVDALDEDAGSNQSADYVWGSSAMLFARNLVRSFSSSGWCQYIRGVDSGGGIENLPQLPKNPLTDEREPPVEIVIPDHLELSLAQAGFIPLVWEKGTSNAAFFSAQSAKYARDGAGAPTEQEKHWAENEQLTANLSYTYTICRLAHYLKMMMRENVGSSADRAYVQKQIEAWISRYVTTVIDPDDLTLRYYPFKAFSLSVEKVSGRVGWFDCTLVVQPHVQFEGVDIKLKVDARLTD